MPAILISTYTFRRHSVNRFCIEVSQPTQSWNSTVLAQILLIKQITTMRDITHIFHFVLYLKVIFQSLISKTIYTKKKNGR